MRSSLCRGGVLTLLREGAEEVSADRIFAEDLVVCGPLIEQVWLFGAFSTLPSWLYFLVRTSATPPATTNAHIGSPLGSRAVSILSSLL
jgi:hypothetical protein